MSKLHADKLFACLDHDLHLERIAGGNETEVYATDDRRYVVKVKTAEAFSATEIIEVASEMQKNACKVGQTIGESHQIPNYFFVAENSLGLAQVVVIQPYLRDALPLFAIDYTILSKSERRKIGWQLFRIIRRCALAYITSGRMPDIYGRANSSVQEREQMNKWYMLPWRLWSFGVKRNLLRSHNLMLTHAPEQRIVLVDYDAVKRGWFYRFIYYNMRMALFGRDYLMVLWMVLGGKVPRA
jgi:hypothetical protein